MRRRKSKVQGPVLILRVAHADDAGFLFRLRNDPETRAQSRESAEVTLDEHAKYLKDTTDRIFIAEEDAILVGSVKFTRYPTELEIGVAVAPEHRGKGYASRILGLALEEAWKPVVAYVREGNERSVRAFKTAGFLQEGTYVRFTSS